MPLPAGYSRRIECVEGTGAGGGPGALVTTSLPDERRDGSTPGPFVAPDAVLVAGDTVDGRWALVRCISSGTGGSLWLARDERLDREVALRFVAAHLLLDDDKRAMVLHEAALLARVEHPNVVCIFDVLDLPSGLIFVGEYVHGATLKSVAERTAPCDEEFVCAVGLQLARGLRAVHECGVIHHDLQHRNVRVLPNGTVKIMNFGSATGFTSAGRTTAALEPPAYLAPEQFDGGPVDHRADIYALGLMLWELATGTKPFPAYSTSAVVETRMIAEAAPLSSLEGDVSEEFSAVVERATRRWPADRWQQAADLEAALTGLCGHRPELAVREHLVRTGFA
jgi:eukaryotic-like serine/threonine-protein kinase